MHSYSAVRWSGALLVTLLGICPAFAADSEPREIPPEPLPPPMQVAGARIGFTRDPSTGRINVHFNGRFVAEHVKLLKEQKRLGTIFFSSAGTIADDDLALLADVPITGLAIFRVPITDRGLAHLKDHPTLESVSLHQVNVTDAGMDVLAEIPKLTKLKIDYGKITDAGLAKVAELKQLRNLGFYKCSEITDDGVIKLAGLTELEMLFLNNNEKLTSRSSNRCAAFQS